VTERAHSGYAAAADDLRERTGVIIPAYQPEGVPNDTFFSMLRETVASFLCETATPEAICLSADGDGPTGECARRVADETGVRVAVGDRNRGKLHALRSGMGLLAAWKEMRYVAAADQDGDHFANELLNFVRAARHAEAALGTDKIMVLGRRISRHRPMGFLRGELEEMADRVLLDSLHYDAAVTGKPLRLEFTTALDEFPDFHSGYKLFTRRTAEDVLLAEPNPSGQSEDCYSRHAVEAVICVEAVKSGATLVEVNRSTWDEQPISAFAQLDRRRMVADKIIWPCKRLEVPGPFVAQWLDNHLPRLLLGTLVPEGRTELLEIRRMVREAFGLPSDDAKTIRRSAFV